MQRELHYVEPEHLDTRKGSALPRSGGGGGGGARKRRANDVNAKISLGTKSAQRMLERFAAADQLPRETHKISELLTQIVLCCEQLIQCADDELLQPVDTARAAWKLNCALYNYSLRYRGELDNDHRLVLWIARIRCVALASERCLSQHREQYDRSMYEERKRQSSAAAELDGNLRNSDDDSAAATAGAGAATATSSSEHNAARAGIRARRTHGAQTHAMRTAHVEALQQREPLQHDRELFSARAILWPDDSPERSVYRWCSANSLLTPTMHDVDHSLRRCSQTTLWRLVKNLLQRWSELPYCAQLLAYVQRLQERVASMCLYSGSSETLFNHPMFSQSATNTDDQDQLGDADYCVNERFLIETERVFAALDAQLHCCRYLRWPERQPRSRERRSAGRRQWLLADAQQRFEDFVSSMLNDGRFARYIDKDFDVVLFDHLLLPGEMERFEQLRPYDDRKPLTCVSRMRRNDYDRYRRLFLEPSASDVWANLVQTKAYTHPAYALLASRAIQYYFDSHYDGASFDAYYVALRRVPNEHLRSSASAALRDYSVNNAARLTRGTARHALCGTFLREGLKCTPDSTVPHPMLVECVGSARLVCGSDAHVRHVRAHADAVAPATSFGSTFMAWLREFCADAQLLGTLANGECVADLLQQLKPTADSAAVAERALAARELLRRERQSLTGIEDGVRQLHAVLQHEKTTRNNSIVL